MSAKAAGTRKENLVKRRLEAENWLVTRGAASLGEADLVALKRGETPMLVQVKANAGARFMNFRPVEREALRTAAYCAGAEAWLVHWPPRAQPVWLAEQDWPAVGNLA